MNLYEKFTKPTKQPSSSFKKLGRRPSGWGTHHSSRNQHVNKRHHVPYPKYHENIKRLRNAIGQPKFSTDPSGNVVNLSNKQFTFPEYNLLNKNLNFCPSPGKYNKATLQKDIDAFTRRIKLKAHFNNENEPNDGRRKDFYIKSNSTWTPHNPHHTIKTFVEALTNEIKSLPDTNIDTRKNNLTKDETKALNDFQQRDDIVITKADKGGAVVIQDVSDYIAEGNRQLNDNNFYVKCNRGLTHEYNKQVNSTIDSLHKSNLLTDKTANMLKTNDPKTPKFYTLPKIHKENNPGRPVISSINCHTAKLSKFVDHHLQEHVVKTASYVKDTTDFLNKTRNIVVPPNSLLVTMDVKSLYTNIPNEEGIAAIDDTLKRSNTDTSLKTVILTFLDMILTLKTSFLMVNIIFKSRAAQWEQNAPRLMRTCLWTTLKQTTFTL